MEEIREQIAASRYTRGCLSILMAFKRKHPDLWSEEMKDFVRPVIGDAIIMSDMVVPFTALVEDILEQAEAGVFESWLLYYADGERQGRCDYHSWRLGWRPGMA